MLRCLLQDSAAVSKKIHELVKGQVLIIQEKKNQDIQSTSLPMKMEETYTQTHTRNSNMSEKVRKHDIFLFFQKSMSTMIIHHLNYQFTFFSPLLN